MASVPFRMDPRAEAARAVRPQRLRDEARRIAADPTDRAEIAAIQRKIDSLARIS